MAEAVPPEAAMADVVADVADAEVIRLHERIVMRVMLW